MNITIANTPMSGDASQPIQLQVYQPDPELRAGRRLIQCTRMDPDAVERVHVPDGGQVAIIDARSAGYE